MLCWPLFRYSHVHSIVDVIPKSGFISLMILFLIAPSSGHRGAILASLVPGINIFRVLLVGLDIWKHEATVKSMSRYGDSRYVFGRVTTCPPVGMYCVHLLAIPITIRKATFTFSFVSCKEMFFRTTLMELTIEQQAMLDKMKTHCLVAEFFFFF